MKHSDFLTWGHQSWFLGLGQPVACSSDSSTQEAGAWRQGLCVFSKPCCLWIQVAVTMPCYHFVIGNKRLLCNHLKLWFRKGRGRVWGTAPSWSYWLGKAQNRFLPFESSPVRLPGNSRSSSTPGVTGDTTELLFMSLRLLVFTGLGVRTEACKLTRF